MQHIRVRTVVWTAVLAVALLALGPSAAVAQEATPEAVSEVASPVAVTDVAYPVHIHSGSCDALGDVVYPLNDITLYAVTNAFSFGPATGAEATAVASPLPGISVTGTTPLLFSVTHIEAEITEFIGGGFAINAHESAEDIGTYIACGDIPPCTGIACPVVTGVTVELRPVDRSGYVGLARIEAAPNGGSNVSIFLINLNAP